MTYISERYEDFEFHDSRLRLLSWDCWKLVVRAECLIVRGDAAPNHAGMDKEIDEARLTFTGFQLNEWRWDEIKTAADGVLLCIMPPVLYQGEKAHTAFEQALKSGLTVLSLTRDREEYELEAIVGGIRPYATVRFCCSSIEMEWEDFHKKAWYELKKQYNKRIQLATPNGNTTVPVSIVFPSDDAYAYGKERKDPSVSVTVSYGGIDFTGYGDDHLWIDAFADLQKKLPEGVKIQCCLTCRYGNMCPVGNCPGELFCMKDIAISNKSDLFFYTEDWEEREKRSRGSTDFCKCYREQSDSYYTYNDYLTLWKKQCGPV